MAKRFVRKLPKGFQNRNLGGCFYACYLVAKYNLERGYTDFQVVAGTVEFESIKSGWHEESHCFILFNTGKVYDPTFEQFSHYPWQEQPISEIRYKGFAWNSYTPEGFLQEYRDEDFTEEFKKYLFTETKQGEFFKGAMWQSEIEHPELIPEKFRIA